MHARSADGNDESCDIIATQDVTLHAPYFQVECRAGCDHDTLTVNGRKHCCSAEGLRGLVVPASTGGQFIEWRSDSSLVRGGWQLCVMDPPTPPTPPDPPMPPMSPPPPLAMREVNPPCWSRTFSSAWTGPARCGYYTGGALDSQRIWAAGANAVGEHMTIDAGMDVVVLGVVTTGRSGYDQWVESYSVQVATAAADGHFEPVTSRANATVFTGNSDRSSRVYGWFAAPVLVRYVRITVQAWKGWISMRAGLLAVPPLPGLSSSRSPPAMPPSLPSPPARPRPSQPPPISSPPPMPPWNPALGMCTVLDVTGADYGTHLSSRPGKYFNVPYSCLGGETLASSVHQAVHPVRAAPGLLRPWALLPTVERNI